MRSAAAAGGSWAVTAEEFEKVEGRAAPATVGPDLYLDGLASTRPVGVAVVAGALIDMVSAAIRSSLPTVGCDGREGGFAPFCTTELRMLI